MEGLINLIKKVGFTATKLNNLVELSVPNLFYALLLIPIRSHKYTHSYTLTQTPTHTNQHKYTHQTKEP